MDDERYIALIHKDHVGSITSSESQELKLWIGTNRERQEMYDSICEIWDATSMYQPEIAVNLDDEYKALSGKMQRDHQKGKVFLMDRWIAAATIALFLSVGLWWSLQDSGEEITSIVATTSYQEVYLPDSSLVIIEKGSKIAFGADFKVERHLSFKGSGFFNIRKNTTNPLTIEGPRSSVTVLGTTFLYEDDSVGIGVQLQLINGSVQIESASQEYELLAGQSIQINKEDQKKTVIGPIDHKKFGWYKYLFEFNKTELSSVIESISSFYNIDIRVDDYLKSCFFTGELPASNIEETLSIINSVYGSKLIKSSSTYILSGGTCK